MSVLPRREIAGKVVEQKDDYQATFEIGQVAARFADKAKHPVLTFRRLHTQGVKAHEENQTGVSRQLPWAT